MHHSYFIHIIHILFMAMPKGDARIGGRTILIILFLKFAMVTRSRIWIKYWPVNLFSFGSLPLQ